MIQSITENDTIHSRKWIYIQPCLRGWGSRLYSFKQSLLEQNWSCVRSLVPKRRRGKGEGRHINHIYNQIQIIGFVTSIFIWSYVLHICISYISIKYNTLVNYLQKITDDNYNVYMHLPKGGLQSVHYSCTPKWKWNACPTCYCLIFTCFNF